VTEALWFLGRGTGVVALVCFTIAVVLGIGVRSGRPVAGLPRFGVHEVHRTASLLGTTLIGVHVMTLLFDPYAQLKLVDLVLPFAGTYRPLWLGLGTLALDLVVAVVVTSLLRDRIGRRGWRAVHWAAYPMWLVALLHGLGTGTDAGSLAFRLLAVGCALAVAGAVAWRLTFPGTAQPTRQPALFGG
jgi:methionine sulfoxide reductase heme-binding subunit